MLLYLTYEKSKTEKKQLNFEILHNLKNFENIFLNLICVQNNLS